MPAAHPRSIVTDRDLTRRSPGLTRADPGRCAQQKKKSVSEMQKIKKAARAGRDGGNHGSSREFFGGNARGERSGARERAGRETEGATPPGVGAARALRASPAARPSPPPPSPRCRRAAGARGPPAEAAGAAARGGGAGALAGARRSCGACSCWARRRRIGRRPATNVIAYGPAGGGKGGVRARSPPRAAARTRSRA